jgi:hypothetical protein
MATDSKQGNPNTAEHKKIVERSNSYPAFSVEYAFELTRKIYLQFGSSSHNTRETIAKVLKMSPNYLIIPLSTATQYGLLEMKSKIGYNPTPLFVQYYKPENDEEKRTAQLECLKKPKLYDALLNAYKGNKLPSAHALATTLFRRYNIAENASLKAAEIFIDNLKGLSLLDEENNLLEIDQTESNLENNNQQPSTNNVPANNGGNNPFNHVATINPTLTDLSMGIKLNDGRKATLIYPEDITDGDWSKIVRVINAMKENE